LIPNTNRRALTFQDRGHERWLLPVFGDQGRVRRSKSILVNIVNFVFILFCVAHDNFRELAEADILFLTIVHRGKILCRLVVSQILDREALSRSEILFLLEVDTGWPVFGSTPICTAIDHYNRKTPSEEVLVEDKG